MPPPTHTYKRTRNLRACPLPWRQVHPCDKRRPLSQTRALYPGVDFSLVDSDEDYLWQPAHRETKEEIQERGEGPRQGWGAWVGPRSAHVAHTCPAARRGGDGYGCV